MLQGITFITKVCIKKRRIQVGNGQHVSVLFIIPIIIEIAGHRFEIYRLVSKIHENGDLFIGIKNMFDLEGVFNSQECCFSFLNRSLPIFPKEKVIIKPGEQKIVKIEAPFTDELSSLAIIKLLDKLTHSIMVLKVKFVSNIAMLGMINNSNSETLILNPREVLGILDLRSLGYYKIKQGVSQQKLSRFYEFESADEVCIQFNNLINTLRKEQKLDTGEKFPWLDNSDERKYMSDREILREYINLDNACLMEDEKEEVMNMLFKYKEAFSSRDEIGTCPNMEVGIDVMDKSLFFIRPYHVREEDKKVIDKEMKSLCYLGILKEGFSPYSRPVMYNSHKLTQDKRVVTDFRHLSIRIAKNNLAYPLVRDTFSVLRNSKCEVLSVLDLKDAFHLLRPLEEAKKYCSILPYFRSASYIYQRMPMGLNISPLIWQSYINAILDCLETRKHFEAIMDNLLLFTPTKKVHMANLEDLLKALLKNGLKISPKKCHLFKTELQYMQNTIFIKDKKVCIKPLRNRIEAILKLEPPKTPKGCRSFMGMVNLLSMFCPELQ